MPGCQGSIRLRPPLPSLNLHRLPFRDVVTERLPPQLTLGFHDGTVTVRLESARESRALQVPGEWAWDDRVQLWRGMADQYREAFAWAHGEVRAGRIRLVDEARAYTELSLRLQSRHTARDYQEAAIGAWRAAGRRGLVVLPTGSGKSHVAHLAMADAQRSTLVVVPTLDLMHQWYSGLLDAFGLEHVGLLGGGEHDLAPVTVTTYDSAVIHMARYGNRFGLVLFDEVHHLPGATYQMASRQLIAPWRLGLTATPERQDGEDAELQSLVGAIVYRREIRELAGHFLATYRTVPMTVRLDETEREAYEEARAEYIGFLKGSGVDFARDGWAGFLRACARSAEGRAALQAWRRQRAIAMGCEEKLRAVEELLTRHADERTLVFTADNATVYLLSRRLLLPTITHQTPTRERREVLQRFRTGAYRALVTSKVLNEGVDVPEASVAIVLSGSGSVREHVQRLGRILRKAPGKEAILYEIVTEETVEEHVSHRRREHDAYR